MARSISKRKDRFAAPVVKDKFIAEKETRLKSFIPTDSQKQLLNTIRENTITFTDSPAGTGKSSAVLWHFCKEYFQDTTKQIMVIRTPAEYSDDKIGFLPNGVDAKLEPHFASAKAILEDFLGKGRVEADMDKRIHFKVPNYMLGCTLDNYLVLVDEAQMLSPAVLKLILERIGQGATVVVAGDSNQLFDAKGGKRNALADAIDRFFIEDEEGYVTPRYEDIGFHSFGVDEIMRSDIVKTVVRAYRGE